MKVGEGDGRKFEFLMQPLRVEGVKFCSLWKYTPSRNNNKEKFLLLTLLTYPYSLFFSVTSSIPFFFLFSSTFSFLKQYVQVFFYKIGFTISLALSSFCLCRLFSLCFLFRLIYAIHWIGKYICSRFLTGCL